MKIRDNKTIEPYAGLKHESYCDDCFANLDWEVHDPGSLQDEKWIAYCNCNNNQRMWTLRVETYKVQSING